MSVKKKFTLLISIAMLCVLPVFQNCGGLGHGNPLVNRLGDFNGDGKVDQSDVAMYIGCMANQVSQNPEGNPIPDDYQESGCAGVDMDGSGTIDDGDFAVLKDLVDPPPPVPTVVGDINLDQKVNEVDWAFVSSCKRLYTQSLSVGESCRPADLNTDNAVDALDMDILIGAPLVISAYSAIRPMRSDFDGDHLVNGNDVNIFMECFQGGYPIHPAICDKMDYADNNNVNATNFGQHFVKDYNYCKNIPGSTCVAPPGDINNDLIVNVDDLALLNACFLQGYVSGSCARADFDSSEAIDNYDFNNFMPLMVSSASTMVGDLNGNGKIDELDWLFVRTCKRTGLIPSCARADLNSDFIINDSDIAIVDTGLILAPHSPSHTPRRSDFNGDLRVNDLDAYIFMECFRVGSSTGLPVCEKADYYNNDVITANNWGQIFIPDRNYCRDTPLIHCK